jgi:hypothetical protein
VAEKCATEKFAPGTKIRRYIGENEGDKYERRRKREEKRDNCACSGVEKMLKTSGLPA